MQEQLIEENKMYNDINTVQKGNLWYYVQTNDQLQLIVPEIHQMELAAWQHKALLHAGKAKVTAALQRKFHWPTMKRDIAKACKTCSSCAILNARR